ncbi:MAG: hypothetical protein COA67_04320 [Lutibacter sp.]|nr:MAG: hypothetical protein COA67_04320 [Lutibacter sp.]
MSLGSMSHTSNRIKTEREARLVRSQKRNGRTNMYSAVNKKPLLFGEFTEEEIKLAKRNVRKKIKTEKRQLLIKVLITSLILIYGIYKLIF